MATPEGKVKDKIKRILKKYGVQYFMPSASQFGRHGAHDFICCMRGLYFSIEAKATAKSDVRQSQIDFAAAVRAAQGISFLIHKDNLDYLEDELRKFSELDDYRPVGNEFPEYAST